MKTNVDTGSILIFNQIQEGHLFKYYRDIILYRRVWNGNTQEYNLADPININDEIINVGRATMSFDEILGDWKTSNMDLIVKNTQRQWNREFGSIWKGAFIPESGATPIYTIQDLQDINNDLTGNYYLANDIDASETATWNGGAGFLPIGVTTPGGFPSGFFSGSLDGLGYTISNLHISRAGVDFSGLFAYNSGTIKNLTIADINMTGKDIMGSVVGWNVGTILNCNAIGGTITGFSAGGIAGELSTDSVVTYCGSELTLSVASSSAGGIASEGAGEIIKCYSKCYYENYNLNKFPKNSGGIVAISAEDVTINNCYAIIDGPTSVSTDNDFGGLVGQVIAGALTINIDKCYAAGKFPLQKPVPPFPEETVGGILGVADPTAILNITNTFWDLDTSGITRSGGGGTGKTTVQMQDINTFTDTATPGLDDPWDMVLINQLIEQIWFIDDGNDYPGLNTFAERFQPEWSEVTAEFGYIDSLGQKNGMVLFRFLISLNGITEDIMARTAMIHLRGYQDIAIAASAEDLPDNQVVGETLGVSTGATQDFFTDENGVGIIRNVYADGVLKQAGTDYQVSDLNIKDQPAKITAAFDAGQTITCDYVYWYQEKSPKFLVEKLIESAGITNYIVQPVSFPNFVGNTVTFNFNNNTQSQSLKPTVGGEKIYLSDSQVQYMGLTVPDYSGSRFLTLIGIASELSTIATNNNTKIEYAQSKSFQYVEPVFDEVTNQYYSPGLVPIGGYPMFVHINNINSGTGFAGWYDWRIPNQEVVPGIPINDRRYLEYIWTYDRNFLNYNSDKNWSKTIGTTPPDNSKAYVIKFDNGDISLENIDKDKFMRAVRIDDAIWVSETVDAGESLVDYVDLEKINTVKGQFTYYTRTQDDDVAWPELGRDGIGWDEVIGGVISSPTRRYIRVGVVINLAEHEVTGNDEVSISLIRINYLTSGIEYELANFTGKTVWDQIKEIALHANYYIGFLADGTFIFRKKDISLVPDLNLYGITNILDYGLDWGRLYNRVITTFGDYKYQIDNKTEGEPRPDLIDKFGVRELQINGGNLLVNDSTNIAEGIAQIYYDKYCVQELTQCRLTCKPFVQLDLGDLVMLAEHIPGEPEPFGQIFQVIKITIDMNFLKNGGMELELHEPGGLE